ncbi:hypothetical protein Tco_0841353 [Tanacetum coccineum]|uniref:Uncharacterized protein n=1 Tax=Tanacetum coccineum TaxID=301880 RepID=A0ABQ5AW59_9ASTR
MFLKVLSQRRPPRACDGMGPKDETNPQCLCGKTHPLKHMLASEELSDIVISGHMTGNRAHLEDYQELSKVGSVTFGGSKGSISGKAGSEHNATKKKEVTLKEAIFYSNIQVSDEKWSFRKELDSYPCLKHQDIPTTTPTSTNPVNTGSSDFNTGDEQVSPGHIEAVAPSAHNVEEVFSDDDDEMPEIRIYDKSSEVTEALEEGAGLKLCPKKNCWQFKLQQVWGTIDERLMSHNPGLLILNHPQKVYEGVKAVVLAFHKLLRAWSQVKQNEGRISNLRTSMKLKFSRSFDLVNVKAAITPMETKCLLTKDETFLMSKYSKDFSSQCCQEISNISRQTQIGIMFHQVFSNERQLKYCDKHNQVGFLLKPTESAGYTEIVDFLRRSKLRYALTHNPPYLRFSCRSSFAECKLLRTLADGTQQLDATIDTIEYTITEESVRRQLQLADASGIHMLQNEEIFAGLQNIGKKRNNSKRKAKDAEGPGSRSSFETDQMRILSYSRKEQEFSRRAQEEQIIHFHFGASLQILTNEAFQKGLKGSTSNLFNLAEKDSQQEEREQYTIEERSKSSYKTTIAAPSRRVSFAEQRSIKEDERAIKKMMRKMADKEAETKGMKLFMNKINRKKEAKKQS